MHTFLRPRARSSTIDNVVVVIGLVFIFVVCKAIYNDTITTILKNLIYDTNIYI